MKQTAAVAPMSAEQDVSINSLLRPLSSLMRVGGLLHTGRSWSFAYSITLIAFLLTGFLRSFANFSASEQLGSGLYLKLVFSVWYFHCATIAVIYLVISAKKNKLPALYAAWDEYIAEIKHGHPVGVHRRWILTAVVVFLFFALVEAVGTVYIFFGPEELRPLLAITMSPLHLYPHLRENVFLKIANSVSLLLGAFPWMLSIFYFVFVASLLTNEMTEFNDAFKLQLNPTGGHFTGDLSQFRSHYNHLHRLISQTDNCFGPLVFFSFLDNVPLLCLNLYDLISQQNTDLQLLMSIMNCSWILIILITLGAVCISGVHINNKAHAAGETALDVMRVNGQYDSELQHFHLEMLTKKLAGHSIGFTAWGTFVLDKQAVLSVVGMIVTYFVLILEFESNIANNGSSSDECLELLRNMSATGVTFNLTRH